jgi:hypothetical protein
MEIKETKKKELQLIDETIQAAGKSVRFAKQNLNTLNMGNDSGEEESDETEGLNVDPKLFMSRQEEAEWNRLSEQKKEQFINQGRKEAAKALKNRGKGKTTSKLFRDYLQNQEVEQEAVSNSYLFQTKNRRIEGSEHKSNIKEGQEQSVSASSHFNSGNVQGSGMEKMTELGPQFAAEKAGTEVAGKVAVQAGGTAATGGIYLAVEAGKKAAEVFKESLESHSMSVSQAMQNAQQKLQNVKEQNQAIDSLPSAVTFAGATIAAAVMAVASVVFQLVASLLSTLLIALVTVVVTILSAVILVGVLAAIIIAIISSLTNTGAGYNLPSFITVEMMETFFETQEQYGIPVSSGIAQVISESGYGLYGPGGNDGQGLSKLAFDYKNLFGIKHFSGDTFAIGAVDMSTGEQSTSGSDFTIVAGFSVYPDYAACIKQRAWMLMRAPYANYTSPFLSKNDGKYTKDDAQNFVKGIREAGWATDISYVQKCIEHMDTYNLYQFDNMTWEQYQSGLSSGGGSYNGTVTPAMQKIVDIARNNQGIYPCTPDMCAAWVTGVYQAAGASTIPWGNAIDMWNTYKHTGSTSKENIPPGAIVCGSGSGYMGSLYGHVGIYLGNGMVANNIGSFSVEPLESWCAWQTANCQGHVGWIGWVYPGGVPQ